MKPRVLFALHLPPPVHGAAMVGQYVQDSATINSAFAARFENLSLSRSLREIGRNPLGKLTRYASILARVLWQLVAFQPHLCYVTLAAKGTGFYKDVVVALLAKLLRCRLVYHFHNKGVSTRQDRWLDDLLYRVVFHRAHVILLSPRLYPDIAKYVPEERVWSCPNGLPDARVPKRIRGDEVAAILFLSNLIESKGVLVLLDACRILRERGVPFRCTFVGGDGDMTAADLRARTEALGLADAVSVTGPLYGADKTAALADADVLAFPTYYEAEVMPLVIIEAMQFALPVVSTSEGGIADEIEDGVTGLVVPKRDAGSLAGALEQLILDRALRRRMGEAGRARYERLFTLSAFEERLTGILHRVAVK